MWIQDLGEFDERLTLLGTRQNIIYLAQGDRHMLIGGGGAWIVPELEQQIRERQIDMDRVRYLLIGHSHYDHCGAVPYLQKRYPHIEVLASHGAVKLFGMEKAVNNMRAFSRQALEQMGRPLEFQGVSTEFDGVRVARALRDGDRIDLGGNLSFNVFETPGHSRCALTVYTPEQQWLFPTDSMAIPVGNGNEFICTASESYAVYLNSLLKLVDLDIQACAWEHYGIMTDEHARDIVRRIIFSTLEYKRALGEHVAQSGDAESTARWAARVWLEKTAFDFLPFDVMIHIVRKMVANAVEEQLDEARYLNA
ncbi:MAG: MBL fold metallo-hydrolase [Desulfobacterales bacterium]|nr:MAG: MBL fold metallo-hydrolase [Desulfobacterales bacterium]